MTDVATTVHKPLRIQAAELFARLKSGEAATFVDVRKRKPWDNAQIKIRDAVRIDPVALPLDPAWHKDQFLVFY